MVGFVFYVCITCSSSPCQTVFNILRESKLTQLMRESLGNFSCRTCLIAHVSPAMQAYNETLQVIQLAAKIHRMKRRRNKVSYCMFAMAIALVYYF